ncbi:diguanylate cyclase domain-containing protein [Thiomicrorhabdus sediminis]|uniref:diguanylate cyclase n=1 Tax=Thiomicrorhabdus sediminis TaxID=2580412 RepID=A0A4P9K756_9GAMM|nr:diguanylate cyclase [Thiomicrorhabdus sediminis]QCU90944.1 diguanylate cyclase [Thiomicrorhabdus sediminis]
MKSANIPNMPPKIESINKKPLYLLALILLTTYLLVSFVLYDKIRQSTIENKLNDLSHHLLYQKALRSYISNNVKPVIYDYMHQGLLSSDYFEKRVLSSAYISEQVFRIYQNLLIENQLPEWQYRIAASNAMNPKNQASQTELELIERFNQEPNLKQIQNIDSINGKEALHVILPLAKTQSSCLYCHGDPKQAPQDLIEQYGSERGFFEPVGKIRGFISYKIDLDNALKTSKQAFLTVNTIILLTSILIFVLVSLIYNSEQKRKLLNNKLQRETHYIAHHDFLTGLKNRHSLNLTLPQKLIEYQESDNKKAIWAIMIDIDHFKKINDSYGHDIGDRALQELGKILKRVAKFYINADVYRLGGEEFLIVLEGTEDSIKQLYHRIQELLDKITIDQCEQDIKVSAGATAYRRQEQQYDFLKRADNALYSAKQQGRNCMVID